MVLADLGELGVLGQKPVTRVYGVGTGDLCRRDDAISAKVTLARRRGPDANRFIGETHVERIAVSRGVDRHGLDTHLVTRADDTQRDLAAVCNQYFT
jgi:hypothetical protein